MGRGLTMLVLVWISVAALLLALWLDYRETYRDRRP